LFLVVEADISEPGSAIRVRQHVYEVLERGKYDSLVKLQRHSVNLELDHQEFGDAKLAFDIIPAVRFLTQSGYEAYYIPEVHDNGTSRWVVSNPKALKRLGRKRNGESHGLAVQLFEP
jgi:hypothetical protein